jgi:hypothetical protein
MATYTDSFTGASANLSSPWIQGRSAGAAQLALDGSGNCRSGTTTTNDCVCLYNNTIGNDHYSQVIVGFNGATSDFVYLFTRVTPNSASWYEGNGTGYYFWSNGTTNTKIQYWNTNIAGLTVIDTANGLTFTAGDRIGLEVIGTTLKVYKNGVAITWTTSGTTSVTDSNVASGFPGIGLSVSAAGKTVDNWQGGDGAAPGPDVTFVPVGVTRTINSYAVI